MLWNITYTNRFENTDKTGDIFSKFFKDFYLFLERGEGKEKERERNISVRLPCTGHLAGNPDVCPDWESNQ